ncbi:MAG: D-glycero-beta-D-manno-heptose 1-phosphate adenylyltransferase [Pseudolabrys sp.]|nr:D-glycero-beta-D-manno-heptose 1-phosphate adenylyltransferase [Pseudolabrys sp.]MBV9956688.1 D-glycero-beta-D-manno-heptose 1-phosphate adenylyltransferase [Pseudolabrys sp.]
MIDFEKYLARLSEQTVLCVGDVVQDEFVYGDVARISAEAPTPVLVVKRTEQMLGGAGNVARNIAALGGRCIFLGVIGDDETGKALTAAVKNEPRIEAHLIVERGRQSTRKVRFVSEKHWTHLARADWEAAAPIAKTTEDALIDHALKALGKVSAIVIADYGLGLLTRRVVHAVIEAATKAGKPVLVDPRGRDYSSYAGATLIKPNKQQLAEVADRALDSQAAIIEAAEKLRKDLGAKATLVTLSEAGMVLISGEAPLHLPSYPVKVRDVSGAGDTVSASLALLMAAGASFEVAARAANAAAAVVVGKRGTATASLDELRSQLLPSAALAVEHKIIFDAAQLNDRLAEWRAQGLRIGFTNGCFDLLHPGHIKVITGARAHCDRLVLGLNSDASTRRLKGAGRPVQDVHMRAEMLAALEAVDLVAVFEDDTPQKLIEQVQPSVLVKGADYRGKDLPGRDVVEKSGGEVVFIDLVPGQSTTSTVERLRAGKSR